MCHQSTLYHSVTKKAVRLLFCASRLDHTSMLFYRCRVLMFKDLVKLKMCSILYKVHYNMPVPANVHEEHTCTFFSTSAPICSYKYPY